MDPNAVQGQITALDNGYNPTDVYNKALSSLGVSDARTRVQALRTQMLNNENLLNNVEGSVTGRTSGALVTEGQRQHLVATEKQPLMEAENSLGRNYNDANSGLTDLLGQAQTQSNLAESAYKNKRQSLADQLAYSQKQRDDAESKRRFDLGYALDRQKASSSAASQAQVDPAKEFLNYLGNQFKTAGGAGNSKISRQQQDAWANAWFQQNGVSQANRQQYWNLFNKTYNRTDDPLKDWRYAR